MAEVIMGFFDKLVKGLTKTRDNMSTSVNQVFTSYDKIDDEFYEDLEETMIMSDMGIRTTDEIITNLKKKVKEQHIKSAAECKQLLMDTIKEQMRVNESDFAFEDQKSVLLMIGINGVGKTTTVGKLANLYRKQGKKVLIAAADTFPEIPVRSSTMRSSLQKPGIRICSSSIQPDVFTIRRI